MLLVLSNEMRFSAYWFKALPLALVVTFALFWLMERLIAMSEFPTEESTEFVLPKVFWEEPPVVDTHIEKIKKIEDPQMPPEIPSNPQISNLRADVSISRVNLKIRDGVIAKHGFSAGFPVPKLLSSAVYPRRALQKGIEGYVDLRFDVSAIGKTENIEVLAASPAGIFDQAAIAAAKKWRFQPVMKNGQGERFEGMSRRVKFEIQK